MIAKPGAVAYAMSSQVRIWLKVAAVSAGLDHATALNSRRIPRQQSILVTSIFLPPV